MCEKDVTIAEGNEAIDGAFVRLQTISWPAGTFPKQPAHQRCFVLDGSVGAEEVVVDSSDSESAEEGFGPARGTPLDIVIAHAQEVHDKIKAKFVSWTRTRR